MHVGSLFPWRARPFKYDPSQMQFFVETQDSIKIKKSDLEKWQEREEVKEVPAEVSRADLLALPAVDGSGTAPSAEPVHTGATLKDSVQKYVESLHQKAAVMTGWIASVDAASAGKGLGDRELKPLGLSS